MDYLMPKPSFQKNSSCTIQPLAKGDKDVHAFLKSISLKVNVIVWLEFELVYYNVAVQHVSHWSQILLLFVLDRNTWNHISVCKQIIIIIK